ncbi:MAG TPA: hypothetical protein VHB21_04780 [Minicystis sp.]|nr:hypothetical protein [Minicystis sp.]
MLDDDDDVREEIFALVRARIARGETLGEALQWVAGTAARLGRHAEARERRRAERPSIPSFG